MSKIKKRNLIKLSLEELISCLLILLSLLISGFLLHKAMAVQPCGPYKLCLRAEALNGYYWISTDKNTVYVKFDKMPDTFAAFTYTKTQNGSRFFEDTTGDICKRIDDGGGVHIPTIHTLDPPKIKWAMYGQPVGAAGQCGSWGAEAVLHDGPPPGVAADPNTGAPPGAGGTTGGTGNTGSDPAGSSDLASNPIIKDINALVKFLSIGIGVIVIIMIILGGIQYSMAGDNPAALTAAKQRIINALIALAAFLLLFAFLQWLIPGGVF